jgi:hypothetical protein
MQYSARGSGRDADVDQSAESLTTQTTLQTQEEQKAMVIEKPKPKKLDMTPVDVV